MKNINNKNSLNFSVTILFACSLLLMVSSCKQEQSAGYEYMPDMYRSPTVETYVDYGNPDSMMSRRPVNGTIPFSGNQANAYNNMPYAYPNTTEGYEAAGVNLKSPIPASPVVLEQGKDLYIKFCIHCHGEAGKGDGSMVKNEKFPPPPSYPDKLKDLPEGKMFHSITYGKGLMGPHAPLLTKVERWKVIQYVQKLQNTTSVTDTAATVGAANADTLTNKK